MSSENETRGQVGAEVYELTLSPSKPDTTTTTDREFEALVQQAFEEAGQSNLLSEGQVTIRSQRPFPGQEEVIKYLIMFGSKIAYDVFVEKVYPKLKARFQAWWEKKDVLKQEPEKGPAEKDGGED
jgi:hypothetical protein